MSPPVAANALARRAREELAVGRNTRVGVIGIGGLGHLALQFAKAFGCEVTALSGTSTKADEAAQLGADHFALTSEPGAFERLASSFDVLLATADGSLPWSTYVSLLRPRGTLVVFSYVWKPEPLEMGLLHVRELNVLGACRSLDAFEPCLAMMADGRLDTAALVDVQVPLAEHGAALDALAGRKAEVFKAVLVP